MDLPPLRRAWRGFLLRVGRIVLGFVFLALGIVGIVTPVMPQVVFFLMAALFFAPDVPVARRIVVRAFRRWPRLRHAVPRKLRRLVRRSGHL